MHLPINVKSPNNISKWQMEFNSAFKGLIGIKHYSLQCSWCSTNIMNVLHCQLNRNEGCCASEIQQIIPEVLVALTLHIVVFWDGTPCILVQMYWRLSESCCLHYQGEWCWRLLNPLKHPHASTRLHGVTSHKTTNFKMWHAHEHEINNYWWL
jgi:hypothetical protein